MIPGLYGPTGFGPGGAMTRFCGSDVGWSGPGRSAEIPTALNTLAARQTDSRFIRSFPRGVILSQLGAMGGRGSGVTWRTGSAFFGLFRGAPPPRNLAGPHPRQLPALASLAPLFTHNGPLRLAMRPNTPRQKADPSG